MIPQSHKTLTLSFFGLDQEEQGALEDCYLSAPQGTEDGVQASNGRRGTGGGGKHTAAVY